MKLIFFCIETIFNSYIFFYSSAPNMSFGGGNFGGGGNFNLNNNRFSLNFNPSAPSFQNPGPVHAPPVDLVFRASSTTPSTFHTSNQAPYVASKAPPFQCDFEKKNPFTLSCKSSVPVQPPVEKHLPRTLNGIVVSKPAAHVATSSTHRDSISLHQVPMKFDVSTSQLPSGVRPQAVSGAAQFQNLPTKERCIESCGKDPKHNLTLNCKTGNPVIAFLAQDPDSLDCIKKTNNAKNECIDVCGSRMTAGEEIEAIAKVNKKSK